MSFRTRVLTWPGTANIGDPIGRGKDPTIAVGDQADHQVEVVREQNDTIVNPVAVLTDV
jgi:hypothetical protein